LLLTRPGFRLSLEKCNGKDVSHLYRKEASILLLRDAFVAPKTGPQVYHTGWETSN